MKHLLLVLFLLLITSCQYFETEKISTETFYEEELRSIDWKEVDQYPSFSNCSELSEKPAQKSCFESTLSQHLGRTFKNHNAIATRDLDDTIQLVFSINIEGKLEVKNVEMDSLTRVEFPLLETWFKEGIDTLRTTSPAYKRGVPVATQFTLPIIIKTENL